MRYNDHHSPNTDSTVGAVTWLLNPMIPAKSLTLLYGESGVGKSFFALNLALTVAITQGVVYIATDGEHGYPQRIRAWQAYHKNIGESKYFQMIFGTFHFLKQDEQSLFMQQIVSVSPKLIILDHFALTMVGSNPDRTKDVGAYVRLCREIMAKLECAIVLVHWTVKDQMRDYFDQIIHLSQQNDAIKVTFEKTSSPAQLEPQYVHLQDVTLPDTSKSKVVVSQR